MTIIMTGPCVFTDRPGEIGPMAFLTYESTRPWAKAIKEAVATKKMPPWFADPAFGHFANEKTLTAGDIAKLVTGERSHLLYTTVPLLGITAAPVGAMNPISAKISGVDNPAACPFMGPAASAVKIASPVIALRASSLGARPSAASWQEAQRSLYIAAPSWAASFAARIKMSVHTYRMGIPSLLFFANS
jgi:hypothetical protein